MLSFKEFLKMVGMKSWMLWLGWLIHALLSNLFSIVVVIILMKVPFWGVAYPPIEFFKWRHLVPVSLFLLYGSNNVLFFDRHHYE
jgi:hypothetical protein